MFLLVITMGCVDPFTPDLEGYDAVLSIQGRVIQGKEVAEIRLSNAIPLGEKEAEPVSRALVSIRTSEGDTYQLQESEPGVYQSDTTEWEGKPGLSYQLSVELPGSRSYESSWEELKASPPIEALTYQFEDKPIGYDTLQGMQIYLSTFDPESQARYYRWEYEETWIFSIPYPITAYWNTSTLEPELFPADQVPQTCWGQDSSTEILIRNTLGLAEDRIVNFPICYVSTEGNQLHRKYSILVKQYTLSEGAYEFWRRAQNVSENLGGLFDPIPTQVNGNIRNVDDPEEQVLGYFSADGLSTKRIFITRLAFGPDPWVRRGFEDCRLVLLKDAVEMQAFVQGGGVYVDATIDFNGNVVGGYTGTIPPCGDCRLNGTQERPDFWE
ncbi:MAG: DUF4249 domain-containing protein [Bacteroidota bacterium]